MSDALAKLSDAARPHHLSVFGACPIRPADNLSTKGAIVLLGPREPGFWAHVTEQAEFYDADANPLDRWSTRVISSLAAEFQGTAHFPFGKPHLPFMTWALRSGRAWSSPVGLLVHDTAGLMVSYRGAIAMPDVTVTQPKATRPCEACAEKPCLTACPPHAMTHGDYDIAKCHAFLDTPPGDACLSGGCLVRRSCPQGAAYDRLAAQSEYHMRQFHR